MTIIEFIDNDEHKKPRRSTAIYSVDNTAFSEAVGRLAGEHYIIVNNKKSQKRNRATSFLLLFALLKGISTVDTKVV